MTNIIGRSIVEWLKIAGWFGVLALLTFFQNKRNGQTRLMFVCLKRLIFLPSFRLCSLSSDKELWALGVWALGDLEVVSLRFALWCGEVLGDLATPLEPAGVTDQVSMYAYSIVVQFQCSCISNSSSNVDVDVGRLEEPTNY